MSFKENLQAKIRIDRLTQKLTSTIRETPGQRRLDKELMRELLAMTDLEPMKARDLKLYTRPLEGETTEVLVFDNELALYHTTVADVALRKSPHWKEMFSINNIRKVLDDKDVVVSKGKESVKRMHTRALDQLDLAYTREDLASLVGEAGQGLADNSLAQIQESFELFFELLGYQEVSLGDLQEELQAFGRPKMNGGQVPLFEDLILFKEDDLLISLKKGAFSPQRDLDLAWLAQFAQGEETADLQGVEVFQYLAEVALKQRE